MEEDSEVKSPQESLRKNNGGSNELLCSLLLGIGQMAMMTGYLGSSNVLESVLRSVNSKEPDIIDVHAGYYGQSLIYATYTFANLITPTLRQHLGSKKMLVIGSSLFTLYQLSFLYLNSWTFYLAAALMGIGYAIFYTGHGAYLSEHSSRKSVERNSALILSAACSSMIVAGCVLLASSLLTQPPIDATITKGAKIYRDFSTIEIIIMFSCFGAISLGSNILFAFLPNKIRSNSLAFTSPKPQLHFLQSVGLMLSTMIEPRMILLAVFFFSNGMFNSFVLGVYPTTFAFTKVLSIYRFLPAASLILVGSGDVVRVVLSTVNYSLILISTPQWATVHPTEQESWIIQPSVILCLVISFLFGASDACVMTARTVICAVVAPERRDQAFAISKLYQSLASTFFFFASPHVGISTYVLLLTSFSIAGMIAYFCVVRSGGIAKTNDSSNQINNSNSDES